MGEDPEKTLLLSLPSHSSESTSNLRSRVLRRARMEVGVFGGFPVTRMGAACCVLSKAEVASGRDWKGPGLPWLL